MKRLAHTPMHKYGPTLLAAFGVCLGAVACSDDSDPPEQPPVTGDGGTDAPPSLVQDAHTDVVDAAPECPKCSSDLHRVLDCEGNTIKTCADDQGCDPDTSECVSACDSARKNRSTLGCEYYSVQPDGSPVLGSPVFEASCYAVYVANLWPTPVSIAVDKDGTTFDLSQFARIPEGAGAALTYKPLVDGKLQPGQVAILFLSDGPSIPCPAGITPPTHDLTTIGTSRGKAFHVTTDRPVAAYDIFPYGGGSSQFTSATLLVPTSAWDDNYMAVDPYLTSRVTFAPLVTQIVAQEDGTAVTIVPSRDIAAGTGVAAAPQNVPTKYTLAKGEVLGLAEVRGLTGSVIQADKPIGMWSSSSCFNVDEWTGACDTAHQQIPPIKSLGNEYVAVRYRNRVDGAEEEAPPWRIMGIVDGTQLSYEPEAPEGAPATLKAGELATFRATGPFVVRSQDDQHPIYMSAHMTGAAEVLSMKNGAPGDPEFVNVVPARQFLNSYVFFTDPTYPETNLVLVRARGTDTKFHDVTLDCAGVLTGWQPVSPKADYEYTRIDLVRHNFAPQNGCDNGRHEIKSDAPFGLTVWGWGSGETEPDFSSQYTSYAYPAGASVRAINTVVVTPVPK